MTGATAKEYILGVPEEGVMATVKHFAANNQEWSRHHASSDVDESTLQEIYFPAFRKAVQEAVSYTHLQSDIASHVLYQHLADG